MMDDEPRLGSDMFLHNSRDAWGRFGAGDSAAAAGGGATAADTTRAVQPDEFEVARTECG